MGDKGRKESQVYDTSGKTPAFLLQASIDDRDKIVEIVIGDTEQADEKEPT